MWSSKKQIENLEKDISVLNAKIEGLERVLEVLTQQLNAVYIKSDIPRPVLRPLKRQ